MKSVMYRLLTMLCAFVLCFACVNTAFASSGSGGDEAEEADLVGSSLYDITTALTGFVNNVVGVNNNANQANNDQADARDHKLTEMANITTGMGGALIGYGDTDKDFQPFLSSNDTKAMTVSSYAAYTNLGDGGAAYRYARYGRLLEDLGLDEVGNVAQISVGRTWGGKVLSGMRVVADLIPDGFSIALKVLKMLNPFWLLTGEDAFNEPGSTSQFGELTDPFNPGHKTTPTVTLPAGGQTTNVVVTDDLTEDEANKRLGALESVRSWFTTMYNGFTSIGLFVILPLLFALLIGGILLTRRSPGSKIATYLKRAIFIVIGIPMLATVYSAVLSELEETSLGTKPSSRIIAASFVNFERWVTTGRLELPTGVQLTSKKVSDAEEQGEANGDTWRRVRITAYKINYRLKIYGIPSNSGIGLGSDGEPETTAGMFDDNGEFAAELHSTDSLSEASMKARLNEMLTIYSDGRTYTSGSWNSAVMGWVTANLDDNTLGNTQETQDSSTNKKTFYQMVFDTDQTSDWMNRSVQDNENIWKGSGAGEEAKWAGENWNIFINGTTLGTDSISTNEDITYVGHWIGRGGDATNVRIKRGLSTVSMYNYLATHFDESALRVYSGMKSVSEFGRMQHFSINLVGSGVLRVLFGVNCLICLGVFTILGIVYCGGLVLHNLKHGFSMLMSIPGAMLGAMKSIAQVLVYFISMILELFVTIFLYEVVTTFVVSFSSVVEGIISPKVLSMEATSYSVVGGIFGNLGSGSLATELFGNKMMFAVGLAAVVLGLIFMAYGFMKLCRVFQVAYAYVSLRFWRLMTCREMLPVYDRVVASYPSLYIWKNLELDFGNVLDLITPEVKVPQKGVVQA